VNIKEYEDLIQVELMVSMIGQQLAVSVFFIDGLLIDTGPNKREDEMLSLFEELDIEQVVLTHHHEDHAGLAHWIQKHINVPIHMHSLGVKKCKKRERLPLYRRLFWGKRPRFEAIPIGENFRTEHYAWEVIHTPGHANDHIALYNPEKKWMFGGDLFVSPKPKSAYRFESVPLMIQSLRKILTYDFDVYICSHAGILFEGKQLLQRKLQYLMNMQQEVWFLHNEGKSVKQIQKELFPKKHFMHYISMFENSPKHFVRSVLEGF